MIERENQNLILQKFSDTIFTTNDAKISIPLAEQTRLEELNSQDQKSEINKGDKNDILKKVDTTSKYSCESLQYAYKCSNDTYLKYNLDALPKLKADGSNYLIWKKSVAIICETNPFLTIAFNENKVDYNNANEVAICMIFKNLFTTGIRNSLEDVQVRESLYDLNCTDILKTISDIYKTKDDEIRQKTHELEEAQNNSLKKEFDDTFILLNYFGDEDLMQKKGEVFLQNLDKAYEKYSKLLIPVCLFGFLLTIKTHDGSIPVSSEKFKLHLMKTIKQTSLKENIEPLENIKSLLSLFREFNSNSDNYKDDMKDAATSNLSKENALDNSALAKSLKVSDEPKENTEINNSQLCMVQEERGLCPENKEVYPEVAKRIYSTKTVDRYIKALKANKKSFHVSISGNFTRSQIVKLFMENRICPICGMYPLNLEQSLCYSSKDRKHHEFI
ncbi:hypothetical protein TBLA_0D02820 [Henningerozyma blattae CBS 6284]|uniref:Uncharacterized protein n=1 Tax=Henningerozyma blattae (strain ATCC 34711 / CBS 6284 / DSM 70876 / NBRC 10599 / NRRL Y-10934 / UCD 77-7) TaxID=1071380 RepID=I2H331_HENB6|nr:hypothetical protein TBLA_0D02820 [Tetrapisispora blattae CBS 6284]CCH60783.1 hypothetical protein TBLA_0D02820 [Tetrapisispora blattae CBS 6284]